MLTFNEELAPTNKLESWKYSDFKKLYKKQLQINSVVKPNSDNKINGLHFSPLNGVLAGSIQSGVEIFTKANCPQELMALIGTLKTEDNCYHLDQNTIERTELAVIKVARGITVEEPIIITFEDEIADAAARFTRLLIIAEEDSEVSVVELNKSQGKDCYINNVCEAICRENSRVSHVKVQRESNSAYVFSSTQTEIAAKANFSSFVFNLGGAKVRSEVHPTFIGEHAESHLYGLSLCNGNQEVDNSTILDHAKPNCFSRELYKGIYNGTSKGAFSGTIIVRQDAQKTNAIQSNQSILLSKNATINTRPQLKIWADDVKCTHGATVGALDSHALFYLRSRGIPENEAQALLLAAFAGEVLAEVRPLDLRTWIESLFLDECHLKI